MSGGQWGWVGACSTGSSHFKSGTPCQDYAACVEVTSGASHSLVAVVSDGAGSAEHASLGSHIVVQTFARCVVGHVRSGQLPGSICEDLVREWIDSVRDRLFRAAQQKRTTPGYHLPHWRWCLCPASGRNPKLGSAELATAWRICVIHVFRYR
jgi:hypothetical protein